MALDSRKVGYRIRTVRKRIEWRQYDQKIKQPAQNDRHKLYHIIDAYLEN